MGAEEGLDILLAQEVAEVGNGVLGVADELRLGLSTVELLALYVREDRGDLTVTILVGDDLGLSFLQPCQRRVPGERVVGACLTPEVKAMDEYEFPKEIPIATRWAGSACALIFCGGAGEFVRPVGVFWS